MECETWCTANHRQSPSCTRYIGTSDGVTVVLIREQSRPGRPDPDPHVMFVRRDRTPARWVPTARAGHALAALAAVGRDDVVALVETAVRHATGNTASEAAA